MPFSPGGVSGIVGTQSVARSPADGYTLMGGTITTHAVNPFFTKNLGYDPVKDFTPVSLVGMVNNVLVVPAESRFNSVAQLIAELGAKPDSLTYGTAGAGTSQHWQAKALAVTSLTRSELQPDLPTLAESGVPGFEAATWLGLLAPAGTPAAVVSWLNKEVVAVLESPSVKTKLTAQGFTPKPMTPEAFRKFIQDETVKFADLIKSNNITIE